MLKSAVPVASAMIALLVAIPIGCNSDGDPRPVPAPAPVARPGTQPAQVVAELSTLKITSLDLNQLLYEAYGLRMMFDLVELGLAKATLTSQGTKLSPADVQRERQMIMAKICGEAAPSDYDNLFNQFLQQERLSQAEFEVKIVQTNAYLRKIVEPIVLGKLPEDKIHRAFEQLYGAKRKIADIMLSNVRDATVAHELLKTQPFDKVALRMSIDRETAVNGGEWPPFSSQSKEIPDAIVQAAFTNDPGQISDILATGSSYHIIKVLEAIPPKIVKYDDVKESVRKELENQLIESDIKKLREALREKAQVQLQIDDPILKAQWDELVAKSRARSVDRDSVGKRLDDQRAHPMGTSATAPATVPQGR